jgi:hypothetical protein
MHILSTPVQSEGSLVINLPHDHGGFGIISNVIAKLHSTQHASSLSCLANQSTWLPDNLGDPSTWTSPPLLAMRSIHEELIANYDCTEDQPSAQQRLLSSCPAGSPTRIVSDFRGCQPLPTATEPGISDPHSAGTEPDGTLPVDILPAELHAHAHPHTAGDELGPPGFSWQNRPSAPRRQVGTFPFGRPSSAPRLVNLSLSSLPSPPTLTPEQHAGATSSSLTRTAITLAHVKATQVPPNRTVGWLPSSVLSSGPPAIAQIAFSFTTSGHRLSIHPAVINNKTQQSNKLNSMSTCLLSPRQLLLLPYTLVSCLAAMLLFRFYTIIS